MMLFFGSRPSKRFGIKTIEELSRELYRYKSLSLKWIKTFWLIPSSLQAIAILKPTRFFPVSKKVSTIP
jgi:hypothetical protein